MANKKRRTMPDVVSASGKRPKIMNLPDDGEEHELEMAASTSSSSVNDNTLRCIPNRR